MPNGPEPTACSRVALPQPPVTAALQRDPFRTVTEALEKSVTYRVPVRVSAAMSSGEVPVAAVGKGPLQPVVTVPLQVAVLITDTVPGESPLALFATYRVWVWSLTAAPKGPEPALAVAARCPKTEWSVPLQVAPLSTATVSPLKPGPEAGA